MLARAIKLTRLVRRIKKIYNNRNIKVVAKQFLLDAALFHNNNRLVMNQNNKSTLPILPTRGSRCKLSIASGSFYYRLYSTRKRNDNKMEKAPPLLPSSP